MKLLSKLTLLSLGVSAIPLAIAGYSSLRIGQRALRGAIEENELTVAKQVADHVGGELQHLSSILRVDARIFDLTRSGQEAPTVEGQLKFLVEHGAVDIIIDRRQMRERLGALLALMMQQPAPVPAEV